MMGEWRRYVELRVKARTGFGPVVVVLGAAATLFGAVAFGFGVAAAFVWLAQSYSPAAASLILAALFFAAALAALVSCRIAQRRAVARARAALAARSGAPWFDPRYLGIAMQVGRAIGPRRLVTLLAAAALAATLAKGWGHRGGEEQSPEDSSGAPKGSP